MTEIIIPNKDNTYDDISNTNAFEMTRPDTLNWLEMNARQVKKKKEVDEKR